MGKSTTWKSEAKKGSASALVRKDSFTFHRQAYKKR